MTTVSLAFNGSDDQEPKDYRPSKQESTPPNPFDPASLRIGQDFLGELSLKKPLLTVPVRKPDKTWWVRVHPGEDFRLQTAVLDLKEDRELYLIAPALRSDLVTDSTFGVRALFTGMNRQGVLFLWPVPLPGPDGKILEWHRSLLEAAEMAMGGWVRVVANMSLGAYDVFQADGIKDDPKWPAEPFEKILEVAFKGRYLDRLDHPVLQRLRGEI